MENVHIVPFLLSECSSYQSFSP